MALYGRVDAISAQAVADLTGKQYHVLRATGAGLVNVASRSGGAQTDVFGVLQNKPDNGEQAAVGIGGESKIVAGAAITVNAIITTNGSGRAIAASSGDWTIGQALEASSTDGEHIRALLRFPSVRLTY